MRQNFRRQTNGNALNALRQQQRELDGKRHGLTVAAVVRELPFGDFRRENNVECEFRQTCLDVTRCSRAVASENVAPVSLTVNQKVFLPQSHKGGVDARVAVRVELHCLPHNVGHLVVAAVVDALHSVKHAALHGFQAVVDVRNGTVENDIRSVIEKPVLVHSRHARNVGKVACESLELFHVLDVGKLLVFNLFGHIFLAVQLVPFGFNRCLVVQFV